jgi:hypothetical protein
VVGVGRDDEAATVSRTGASGLEPEGGIEVAGCCVAWFVPVGNPRRGAAQVLAKCPVPWRS